MEVNNEVELGEEFQPSCLMIEEDFGSQKILQVFVICNNVYRKLWPFQVVALNTEGFKDYKKFLVICIVVEFCSFEHTRVKYDQIYFFFFHYNQ